MRAAIGAAFVLGAGLLATSGGCLRSTVFQCATSLDCGTGTCELTGYCSFADTGCPSGWRYGDHSDDLSGVCVGGENPDGPPGQIDASIDARVDASNLCPPTYDFLSGQNHKYRLLTEPNTKGQQEMICLADGAYLTVPDDAAELTQITGLSGNVWIGINDQMTEGVWMTSLGVAATYLPWAPGQPDDQGPGEHCGMAQATLLFYDERCGDQRVAVCECVP